MCNEHPIAVSVDFLWEEQRLAVQVDGPHRPTRNSDERHANLALEALGYRVLHLTEREIDEEPDRIVALLRHELENRPNQGSQS